MFRPVLAIIRLSGLDNLQQSAEGRQNCSYCLNVITVFCVCVCVCVCVVKLCDILTVKCLHCITERAICSLVSFVLCKCHVERTVRIYSARRDSSVIVVTGIGIGRRRIRCSTSDKCSKFSSSPQCPQWLWTPPSILSNEFWGLFSWGLSDRGVKLTPYLPRLMRVVSSLPHAPFLVWCVFKSTGRHQYKKAILNILGGDSWIGSEARSRRWKSKADNMAANDLYLCYYTYFTVLSYGFMAQTGCH